MPEEIAHEWPVHIKSIDIPKKRKPETLTSHYNIFSTLKRPRINAFRDDEDDAEFSQSRTHAAASDISLISSERPPVFKPLKSSLRSPSISSLLRERIEARAALLKIAAPQSLKRDSRSGRVDFEDTEEEIKEDPSRIHVPISLLQRADDLYGVHSDDSLSSVSSNDDDDDDDDDDDEIDNLALPPPRYLRSAENKPTSSTPFFLAHDVVPRRYDDFACLTVSNFDDEEEDIYRTDPV